MGGSPAAAESASAASRPGSAPSSRRSNSASAACQSSGPIMSLTAPPCVTSHTRLIAHPLWCRRRAARGRPRGPSPEPSVSIRRDEPGSVCGAPGVVEVMGDHESSHRPVRGVAIRNSDNTCAGTFFVVRGCRGAAGTHLQHTGRRPPIRDSGQREDVVDVALHRLDRSEPGLRGRVNCAPEPIHGARTVLGGAVEQRADSRRRTPGSAGCPEPSPREPVARLRQLGAGAQARACRPARSPARRAAEE